MEFLDRIILDNSIRSYLVVLVTILVVLLFKRLLSHSVASILYIFVRRAWKTIEKKEFITLILKPLSWFIVIVVSVFAIDKLNFPGVWEFKIYGHHSQNILEKAGVTIIIISFIWLLLSLIDFIALILEQKARLTKDHRDDQIIIFFRDFLKVIIIIAGVLMVLKSAFNQNIGTVLTGLSIVGAALALAGKESLENLIASFIIFFDKPFFTGDTLKVNNVTGTVEKIGLRSTRIRTTEKTLVTVPNKQMVDSIVDNMSMRSQRRAEIKLELSEKTRAEEVQQFIDSLSSILSENATDIVKHSVFLTEFGKNGATITVEYFTSPGTMTEYNKLKQKLNFEIMKKMADAKIELATGSGSVNIYNNDPDAGMAKNQPLI